MARILIIEDDDGFRALFRKTLERMGHEVLEAIHGGQAIPIVEKEKLDLVVTDLIMPEKEGLETIPEIRRIRPKLKILAISGGGKIIAKDMLRVSSILGANKTLAKPFTREELESVLADLLGPQGKKPGD